MVSESSAGISEHSRANNPLSWKHSEVSVILESAFPGKQFWIFSTCPSSPFISSLESRMRSSVLWDQDTADVDANVSCRVPHTKNLCCFEEGGSSCGCVWGNSVSPPESESSALGLCTLRGVKNPQMPDLQHKLNKICLPRQNVTQDHYGQCKPRRLLKTPMCTNRHFPFTKSSNI